MNRSLCCLKFVQVKFFHSLEERRILLFIFNKTEALISQSTPYLFVLKGFIKSISIKRRRTVLRQWHTICVLVNIRKSYYRATSRWLGDDCWHPDRGLFSSRLQPRASGDQVKLLFSSVQQDEYTQEN